MNLPNKLTLMRVILVPVFMAVLYLDFAGAAWVALAIFIIASLTDLLDGKIARHAKIRIVRDGVVICEDEISSLKRFKDDAREVATGYECGVGLRSFNDIKEGDIFEAFIMEEVAQ